MVNPFYFRPVTALYWIEVMKIDEDKKLEAKKLYH